MRRCPVHPSVALAPMKNGWLCEECGAYVLTYDQAPFDDSSEWPIAPALAGVDLESLPSFLALPAREWAREAHPVQRLWRISDTFEVFLRYLLAIALADLARRNGGVLPDDLRARVGRRIGAPSYGVWIALLRDVFSSQASLRPGEPAPAARLAMEAFERTLLPLLGGNDGTPERHLLALRNLLAHAGGMRADAAREFLQQHGHEMRALGALQREQEWLSTHVVLYVEAADALWALRGPRSTPAQTGPASPEIGAQLVGMPGAVVLLGPDAYALDLSPVCGFGVPEIHRTGMPVRRGAAPVPEVYVRRDAAVLLYNALDGDLPLSHRGGEAMAKFQSLFGLDLPSGQQGAADADSFDAELRSNVDAMVGRTEELHTLVSALAGAQQGVFWLSGQAGMGKSMLVAAVASHPKVSSDPSKLLIISHRFQAGDPRCSRLSFLRRAVSALEGWARLPLASEGDAHREELKDGADDPRSLERRLCALLDRVGTARPAPYPNARAPRILFLLDGLDEIALTDPEVLELPLRLNRPNVVWFCAGRPDRELVERFGRSSHVTVLFPAGLPPMSEADLRALILTRVARLRYDVLSLDIEGRDGVRNVLVSAVAARARGLPLYATLVIDDLVRGQLRVATASEDLPESLELYYEALLRRYAINDLHQVLTPLIATLAMAGEPLGIDALHALLCLRTLVEPTPAGQRLVVRALEAAGAMLKPASTPEGERGYMVYHETFRQHVAELSAQTRQAAATTRAAFAEAALRWHDPALEPAACYLARQGVIHLLLAGRPAEALELVARLRYGEWVCSRVGPSVLADAMEVVVERGVDGAVGEGLALLAKTIRLDAAFLRKHPELLLQIVWNRGSWPSTSTGSAWLRGILDGWRREAAVRSPAPVWVRSLRPPLSRIDSPLLGELTIDDRHHDIRFSASGGSLLVVSNKGALTEWSVPGLDPLSPLAEDKLSGDWGVSWSKVEPSPDGRALVALREEKDGDAARLAVVDCAGAELLSVSSRPGAPFAFSGPRAIVMVREDGAVCRVDVDTGACVVLLEGSVQGAVAGFSRCGRFFCRMIEVEAGPLLEVFDLSLDGAPRSVAISHEPDDPSFVHASLVVSGDGSAVAIDRAWIDVSSRLVRSPTRLTVVRFGGDGTHVRDHEFGDGISCLRFSEDGRWLLLGVGANSIVGPYELCILDVAEQTEARTLGPHGQQIEALDVHAGRGVAASVDDTGKLCLWRLDRGAIGEPRVDHKDWVTAAAASADGRYVLTGGDDGAVILWTADGGFVATVEPDRRIQQVGFSPLGHRFFAVSKSNALTIWDTARREQLGSLDLQRVGDLSALGVSDRGPFVLGRANRLVGVWNWKTGKELFAVRVPERIDLSGYGEAIEIGLVNSRSAINAVVIRAGGVYFAWDARGRPLVLPATNDICWFGGTARASRHRRVTIKEGWRLKTECLIVDTETKEELAWWPTSLEELVTVGRLLVARDGRQKRLIEFLWLEMGDDDQHGVPQAEPTLIEWVEAPALTWALSKRDSELLAGNRWGGGYLGYKVWFLLRVGPVVYRRGDFFGMPLFAWDEARVNAVIEVCRQLLAGCGDHPSRPLVGVEAETLTDVFTTFHFEVSGAETAADTPGVIRVDASHRVRSLEVSLFSVSKPEPGWARSRGRRKVPRRLLNLPESDDELP
jgi:WD40 repeat protein